MYPLLACAKYVAHICIYAFELHEASRRLEEASRTHFVSLFGKRFFDSTRNVDSIRKKPDGRMFSFGEHANKNKEDCGLILTGTILDPRSN
jgi:hypothetical protein